MKYTMIFNMAKRGLFNEQFMITLPLSLKTVAEFSVSLVDNVPILSLAVFP